MRIVDDHEVTKSEQITRFVCGAILGVVVSVVLICKFDLSSFGASLITALVSIIGCGLLALLYGDRFWIAFFGGDRF